ncbi:class I adenylate-forming enzyme family protein [Alicycliphilus sp. T452]
MQTTRIHESFDRRLKTAPDQVYLHTLAGPLTYADLGRLVDRLEEELRRLEVGTGDRVFMVAENCPEHMALILACSRVGAWACSVNARMAPAEVDLFQQKADARVVYFTSEASNAARAHAQRMEAMASVVPSLSRSPVRTEAQAAPSPLAEEVVAIIFTSGTTGAPKGVMITHAGLMHYGNMAVRFRKMTPQDRSYAFLPMTHIFGLGAMLMASLQAGSSLVLRPQFEPADAFDALAHHGISVLQGPPAMFSRLIAWLDEQGIQHPACPSLRYMHCATAPLDLSLKREIEKRFGQPVYHGYGMSEYAGGATMVPMGQIRDDISTGAVLDGAEMRIVDPDGRDVPQGERGEIWLRGVGLMPGYFRDEKATADVMRPGGWYATGDIGLQDHEGNFFIVGRLKEMIIRSGFNVYPAEVEAVLLRCPAVRNAAVVGRKEDDGNEEIWAFIETVDRTLLDKPALDRYLRDHLTSYKRPGRIVTVDAMPMTSSGKILKRALFEIPGVLTDQR